MRGASSNPYWNEDAEIVRPSPPTPPPTPSPSPPPPPPSAGPDTTQTVAVEYNSIRSYRPLPWSPPTSDVDIINEVADCLQKPPTDITQNYTLRMVHIAEWLKVPATSDSASDLYTKDIERMFLTTPITNPRYSMTNPVIWVANEDARTLASQAVSNVLALVKRVENFSPRATVEGYKPLDNPFTIIAGMNASRGDTFERIDIPEQNAADLVWMIKHLLDLMENENQDNSPVTSTSTSQLSHVTLSYDGFGGSGNAASDVLNFMPDADALKKEQARLAAALTDFTQQIPYILFTMDYKPVKDGPSVGTLIGWKKIPDASGYIISRRRVFANAYRRLTIDNATLNNQSQIFRDYVKTYATTFFNKLDENSVLTYLDPDVRSDEYYIYKIQAYQMRSEQKGAVFSIEYTPVSLIASARSNIIQTINTTNAAIGIDESNPWPALAQYIYNDSTYDWILAAVNVRASINRGDNRETTRSYYYLNTSSNFLFSQADAGRLVKPTNANSVINNVNDSIQKYGISQTIQNLFDETGISYFFEGRDAREETQFDRVGTKSVITSKFFNIVASAIDPQTAIVNLQTLITNMTQLLDQQLLSTDAAIQPGDMASQNSKPKEFAVPDANNTVSTSSNSRFQYLVGDMRDVHVDLTTFEGISKFMRVIRVMSSLGVNRNQAVIPVNETVNQVSNTPSFSPSTTIIETIGAGKLERQEVGPVDLSFKQIVTPVVPPGLKTTLDVSPSTWFGFSTRGGLTKKGK